MFRQSQASLNAVTKVQSTLCEYTGGFKRFRDSFSSIYTTIKIHHESNLFERTRNSSGLFLTEYNIN